MNLGLNFINQLDVPEIPMLKAYARKTGIPWKFIAQPIDRKRAIFQAISDSFTNKMRVTYGQTKVEELAIPRSAQEVLSGGLGPITLLSLETKRLKVTCDVYPRSNPVNIEVDC